MGLFKEFFTQLNVQGVHCDLPYSLQENEYWAKVGFSVTQINLFGLADKLGGDGSLQVGLNSLLLSDGVREVRLGVVRQQDPALLWKEPWRPGLHVTPEAFSLNDPNGLIMDEETGEYHLFFQCDYPFRGYMQQGDTKAWGHAVSRDLLDWQEKEIAIPPDENGVIWSGSGVIDRYNTSGLFDDSTPPGSRMVFLYTYFGGRNTLGQCSIGLAYSPDHGESFINKGPVIRNTDNMYSGSFRDPNVFWYADARLPGGGTWVLIACGEYALLFTSPDLRNWVLSSALTGLDGQPLVTECPDIFCETVNGEDKYVLLAAGVWYIVGHMALDGETLRFVAETEKITPINGVRELWEGTAETHGLFPENYASQTFYNTPGRHVQMSWIRDFGGYAGKMWWNALSLPTELRLTYTGGQPRLTYHPIAELAARRTNCLLEKSNVQLSGAMRLGTGNLLDIEMELKPGGCKRATLRIGEVSCVSIILDFENNRVVTDKRCTELPTQFVYDTPADLLGPVTLRVILDAPALDVYVAGVYHGGLAYGLDSFACQLEAEGELNIISLTVCELQGITR